MADRVLDVAQQAITAVRDARRSLDDADDFVVNIEYWKFEIEFCREDGSLETTIITDIKNWNCCCGTFLISGIRIVDISNSNSWYQ